MEREQAPKLTAKQLKRYLDREDIERKRRKLRVEPGTGGWDYVCIYTSPAADRPTWPHPTAELKQGVLVGKHRALMSSGPVHVDADLPPLPSARTIESIHHAIGGYSYTWLQSFVARYVSLRLFQFMYAIRPRLPVLIRVYVRGKRYQAWAYLRSRSRLWRHLHSRQARAVRRKSERQRRVPRFGTRSIEGVERDLARHLSTLLAPDTRLRRVHCRLGPDDWDLWCGLETDRGRLKIGVMVLDTGVMVLSKTVALDRPIPPPPPPKPQEP